MLHPCPGPPAVLDDNCTLCLPNGERIKLNPVTMRMLFEVQDLSVASPATVSRCGMVYIALEELGWRPSVRTWCDQQLPAALPSLNAEAREYIYSLFDAHIDAGLAWLKTKGREFIPLVENNRTASLCALMVALMAPSRGFKFDRKIEDMQMALGRVFSFAYVWAMGGNLEHTVQGDWDEFVREQLANTATFPGGGTVYDYFLEGARSFPPEFKCVSKVTAARAVFLVVMQRCGWEGGELAAVQVVV